MNRYLVCCVISVIACAQLLADPEIPANAWEQHPEGIATATELVSSNQKGTQKKVLIIYIKNTSDAITYWVSARAFRNETEFFEDDYVVGVVDCLNYPAGTSLPETKRGIEIKPGGTYPLAMDISKKEMGLIRNSPVKCHLTFVNVAKGQIIKRYVVETAPQVLVRNLE